MTFKDSEGSVVSLVDIINCICAGYEYEVFVGTDSQVCKKKSV